MVNNIQPAPLIIIGLDGGDPDLIQHWAETGYLPNIQAIMQKGCWGKTTGIDLLNEDGVWTRLFSGIPQKKHGFYYFRQLKSESYNLYTASDIEAAKRVFWSLYQETDKKAALIDIPDMILMPSLKGLQLANWAVHNSHFIAPTCYPKRLLSDINRNFGIADNITEKFTSNFTEDKNIYRRLLNRVLQKGQLCRHLCSQNQFDLVIAVFGECHTGGHQFWKYRPEALGDEKVPEPNALTNAIRDIYQAIDREIGLLIKQLPETANIAIISSVGLTDHYSTEGLIEDFCRKLNYQASPDENTPPLSILSLLRKLIPDAWRMALNPHLPRNVKERLLAENFRYGTQWRKTKAFAIPSAYMSFLRVNLHGREPLGTVAPGDEYQTVLRQLETDLQQLIDARSGQKAVKKIWRADELFGFDRHPELPDLLVEWQNFPYFMERVLHPSAVLTQRKPEFFRGSDHSHHGFIALSGAAIPLQGKLKDIPVSTLAPTFVSLIGEKIPHWMGRDTLF